MAAATVPGMPLPPGVRERHLAAGGVEFRYLHGGPELDAAGRTPLLLLHGWPTWAEVWLPMAEHLAPDRPWIAIDLPCHGRTGLLPPRERSLTGYRRALAAFVDALGAPRVSIAGCSIGGTLSVMVALDRPARVASIVAIDAAGFAPKLPGRTVRMYLPFFLGASLRAPGAGSMAKLLRRAVFHDAAFATPEWAGAMAAQWAAKDRRKALLATGGALRKPDASVAGVLGEVGCPALVLWGEGDPQFDWRIGEAGSRRMRDSRFVPVPAAGHFPMVERPSEVGRAIEEFLAARSA